MNDIDPYKIPAFQRKAKINSKTRSSIGNSAQSYRALLEKEAKMSQKKKRVVKVQLDDRKKAELKLKKRLLKKRAAAKSGFSALSQAENRTPVAQSSSSFPISSSSRLMKIVGQCTQYFDKINVAVVELEDEIGVGDQLIFQMESGLFEQKLCSMQINRQDVQIAKRGDSIGLKVEQKPLSKGWVYKVA